MKTLLTLILFLVALALGQGAPTALSGDAEWESYKYQVISNGTFDSLMGANDSSTLASNSFYPTGWHYVLQRGAMTGVSTSDSVKVAIRIDVLDTANRFLYSVYPDSFLTLTGEQVVLPINRTVMGENYTIKALSFTGAAAKCRLNNVRILKVRPRVVTSTYSVK